VRFLIRTWTRQGGENVFSDRVLNVERLRIGRGTDQDIELPDLRIAVGHAEIVRSGRNAMIAARTGASFQVNGSPSTEHRLHGGDVIVIGRYQLLVTAGTGGADLQIDLEERISARDEKSQRQMRLSMTLDEVMPSQRLLSWLLFLLVLGLGLGLPAWLRFGHEPPPPAAEYTPPAPVGGFAAMLPSDHSWVPGSFSSAHAYFQRDCAKCHEAAFQRVRNEACLSCHKNTAAHVDDPHWLALDDFAKARCEDCHHEHKGDTGLVAMSNSQCTACHADPAQRFASAMLQPARDFARHHPVFTPRVARYDAATRQFRWIEANQEQPETLHSDTNLKYPHDKHLDPKGIKSPDGLKVLGCGDCHEPDSAGVSFKPVDMQKHCAACHRLDFDPDDPQRTVPHAQPAQVAAVIRDYYARAALAGGVHKPGAPEVVQLRRRPGEQLSAPEARAALDWADHQSAIVIEEVFDRRVCGYCHVVSRSRDLDVPWSVAPVVLPRHRLDHAGFSHAAHRSETCESCHAAQNSRLSTDVLLPGIKRCRDCHGDPGSQAQIQSSCLKCHGYHIAREQRMGQPPKQAAAGSALPMSAERQP
jgi:hypothetical protein